MKTLHIILFVSCLSSFIKAQAQYPIELPAYNIGTLAQYTIQAKVVGNNVYEYTIRKEGDSSKVKRFTLRPNSLTSFRKNVEDNFKALINEETEIAKLQNTFDKESNSLDLLFFQFVASEIAIDSYDNRPVSGKLYFGKIVSPSLSENEQKDVNESMKFKLDSAYEKNESDLESKVFLLKNKISKLKNQFKSMPQDELLSLTKQYEEANIKFATLDSLLKKVPANYENQKREILQLEKQLDNLESAIRKYKRKKNSVSQIEKIKVGYTPATKFTIAYGSDFKGNLSRSEAENEYQENAELILKGAYSLKEVEIEFNEGFIENIKAIVQLNGKVLKFENIYPIGFSTKRNFRIVSNTFLFATDEYGLRHQIRLSEVIKRYEQKHEVDRRDYSPANEVVNFDYQQFPDGAITLHKELTSKLFELKTFSDFVGFDQSAPNGLIQIELERRLNLVTLRHQLGRLGRGSLGVFQFITPSLLKSKFEENNKYLTLDVKDQFANNQYSPIKFTSTLELKRYENFSVGTDLNLFLVDFPSSKLTYYFNTGFRYGRVAIRDSTRVFENNEIKNNGFVQEFGVNTYQLMPIKTIVEFKTDERYSVNLAWSLNLYYLRDNRFEQVANIPSFKDDNGTAGRFKYMYHNIHLGTSFKPSSTGQGKLFFRYQYNWQQGYWRTGFHQAQVGYSTYLTKTLKPSASK